MMVLVVLSTEISFYALVYFALSLAMLKFFKEYNIYSVGFCNISAFRWKETAAVNAARCLLKQLKLYHVSSTFLLNCRQTLLIWMFYIRL